MGDFEDRADAMGAKLDMLIGQYRSNVGQIGAPATTASLAVHLSEEINHADEQKDVINNIIDVLVTAVARLAVRV